jgi:hypothetical protein
MSVIWPGMDLLIKSYVARQHKGGIRYEYPFRIYPPPGGFNRGKFDQSIMDEIHALWKRLHPKAKAGGRMQMNTIELRATIFCIRANLAYIRKHRHDYRRWSPEGKTRIQIDDESFIQLKTKSQRVILSLERHMKRANRILLKSITREQYMLLVNNWSAHLRWMWLHIAHFKPRPPIIRGGKARQQMILDELMQMAKRGIEWKGYQAPEPEELRRMIRLYVRSARRGREGDRTVSFLLEHKSNLSVCWFLFKFIRCRLVLKELSKS